jgi:hypothetical protein
VAYTLDTAAATDRLTAAGMDAKAARAVVAVIAQAKQARSDLLTKADLRLELARFEQRVILWAVVIAGILFAALRLTA